MIYIYHARGTDLYKIGYTSRRNAARRRQEWETGCPYPLDLVGTLEGDRDDEARLHRRLKRKGKWQSEAVGQEWFKLTEADVTDILDGHAEPISDVVLDAAVDLGERAMRRKLNNVSRRKGLQGLAGKALKWWLKKR